MKKIYQNLWTLAEPYYRKGRPIDITHVKILIDGGVDIVTIARDGLEDKKIPEILTDAYYQPEPLTEALLSQICVWLEQYAKRSVLEQQSVIDDRKQAMNRVNPKYVMRNYLAQQAIEKSEQGDHSMLEELLDVMRKPYDEQPENEIYAEKRPEWARYKAGCSMLSCSS